MFSRKLAMVLAKGIWDFRERSFCHEVTLDNIHLKAQKYN